MYACRKSAEAFLGNKRRSRTTRIKAILMKNNNKTCGVLPGEVPNTRSSSRGGEAASVVPERRVTRGGEDNKNKTKMS